MSTTVYTIHENISLKYIQDINRTQIIELDYTYDDLPINNTISEYKIDIIVYISGFTTRKLQKQIDCFECKIALKNNLTQSLLIDIKNRGGLVSPSRDTFNINIKSTTKLRITKINIHKEYI